MKFTPRPYQNIALDFLASEDRCSLWAKMGMGKSVTTLSYLQTCYEHLGETAPTLIIAPLRVARDTWVDETRKWDHLSGFDVAPILGTEKQRLAALKKDVPAYTVNYEQLPWLVKTLGSKWRFGRVVADEARRLKGYRTQQGSQRAQALAGYAHRQVKHWINLTGTPAANGLEDLWGQQWFIDGGKTLGSSFEAFKARWFSTHSVDGKFSILRPRPGANDEIQKLLASTCLTLDPKDWFNLKDPIVVDVPVKLPTKARKVYDQMEAESVAEIKDKGWIKALSSGGKVGKALQIASGAVYLDPEYHPAGTWEPIHDEKLSALESIVEESGGASIMVAYHWKHDLARIMKTFPGAVDLATTAGLKAFKSGSVQIGVAHPLALGHGVDGLQNVCNIIVFYSQDWNLDSYLQIIERIGPMRQLQSGNDRDVWIYRIIADDTMDEVVVKKRNSKDDTQEALLKYLKRKHT